ncbi:respiratory chain complex I subunit 1 family protein [Candidatus Auribacterota bacterium]
MNRLFALIIYLMFAPFIGAVLAGIDRKITARMQSRVGPPLQQPIHDVFKLLKKENLVVRKSQNFYIVFFMVMLLFTGGLFFSGENILLVIFAFTLAEIFFVLGGFKASSPYSHVGSQRELIQIMAVEPVLIFMAIGAYLVTKSFNVADIVTFQKPLFIYMPGILIAFVYILAVKLRKSPFDLSTSHHGHQELVKGITTEFSGKALAMIEVSHWLDSIIIMGFMYLFFASHPFLGIIAVSAIYTFVCLIDNVFARVKWQLTLKSCWIVAVLFGFTNIMVLFYILR